MTYSEPLGIIGLAGRENSFERIVSGDDESSKVGKDLSSEVKQDEEEVEADNSKDGVNLGDGCLLLEVVEDLVLRQLRERASLVNIPDGQRLCAVSGRCVPALTYCDKGFCRLTSLSTLLR